MRNAGLDEAQARIKTVRRNLNNIRYGHDITVTAESDELKSLLVKLKEESEKVGLKFNIQIMASSPITSWQIDRKNGNSDRLFRGAPKSLQMVTIALKLKDACSLEENL